MSESFLYLNYKISLFSTALIVLILAVIVFFQKTPQKNVKNTFILYSITLCIWSSGQLLSILAKTPSVSLFYVRNYCHSGVIFIPILFYHFTMALLGKVKEKKSTILFNYIVGGVLLLLNNLTPLIVKNVGLYPPVFRYIYIPGKLHPYFVGFFLYLAISATIILWKSLLIAEKQRKTQLKYLLFAVFLSYIGGVPNFLLGYRIQIPIIMPFGTYLLPLYVGIIAYTIVRHRLLDIRIFIKKTLLYSLVITIITIVYFLIIYSIERTFSVIIGYKSTFIALIIIAFFSIIFIPLKNKIQYLIDKYFFHGSIGQIDEENTLLREEIQKSEKMKVVATLAAGMAHEIKNPLTSIKTFTEYIKTKQNDPDFIDKFQQIVGSEVDKIDSIVKQLLEFSKPQELHLKETDINSLLDETLSLLNNDFLKHAIRVEKFYSPISPIKVDPVQIKQVFLNLLLNAIDAIEKDGKITISTETTDNDQICITIEDTGKGISKEDLKHVFDPFFTKKDSGTGLGLSIVHGIIEKHGGKIIVESNINKGTKLTITMNLEH